MTVDDVPLMFEWLRRPHLLEWWRDECTLDEVRDKYLPRIAGDDDAKPFMVYLDNEPVGYIQYYDAAKGDPAWWPDTPGPGVLGIDQFIADPDRLSRGLGTAMVRQFATWLMEDPAVTEIRVDPRPDNLRAIRCYEKVGFKRVANITTPDGPAVMMVLLRSGESR